MDQLQILFDETLKTLYKPENVLGLIIAKKLKARGVRLSESERKRIGKHAYKRITENKSSFSLGLRKRKRPVHIEIGPADLEALGDGSDTFEEVLPVVTRDIAKVLYASIKRDSRIALASQRFLFDGFASRLYSRWRKALDSFDLFVSVARDAGAQANAHLRTPKYSDRKYLVECLTRLHARACQIAGEIDVLLRSGYADGAHARWRTLHEIEVVTALLSKHGEQLAERYLLYDHVESLRAAVQFNGHARRLGERRFSKMELARLERTVKELCSRFGETYKNRNGWACILFPTNGSPSFSDLEAIADFDHVRPFYKMASHNVHAEPKGTSFRIGVLPPHDDELILCGPSNAGLQEAGRLTGYSLLNITYCMLTVDTNIDSLVYGQTLIMLEQDASRNFYTAAAKLDADAARIARGKGKKKKPRPTLAGPSHSDLRRLARLPKGC